MSTKSITLPTLSRKYYYDLQTKGDSGFEFDSFYIDFYPADIWDNEKRIPYLFENEDLRKDNDALYDFLVNELEISEELIERDGAFIFFILDTQGLSMVETTLKSLDNNVFENKPLPLKADELPESCRPYYSVHRVSFKATETGTAATETEQIVTFVIPRGLLDRYQASDNVEDIPILNQNYWSSVDHRFNFFMKERALEEHNLAFDLLDVNSLFFPCYPDDVDEKLPTDKFCLDEKLVRNIYDQLDMEENEVLYRLGEMHIAQIGLDTNLGSGE